MKQSSLLFCQTASRDTDAAQDSAPESQPLQTLEQERYLQTAGKATAYPCQGKRRFRKGRKSFPSLLRNVTDAKKKQKLWSCLSGLKKGKTVKHVDKRSRPAADVDGIDGNFQPRILVNPRMNETKDQFNMEHGSRGHAVIFNQEDFHPSLEVEVGNLKRHGSAHDALRMQEVLRNYGFDVQVHSNLNKKDILKRLQAVSKNSELEDSDCFVCVILSHGEKEGFYAHDKFVNFLEVHDLFLPSRCPSLAGKPKIFIIQACRGQKRDRGVFCEPRKSTPSELSRMPSAQHPEPLTSRNTASTSACADCCGPSHETDALPVPEPFAAGETNERDKGPAAGFSHPDLADFFSAHATVEDYVSWRHKDRGSPFIQALCHILEQHAHIREQRDLCELFTMVNKAVAERYETESSNPDHHAKKQCCEFRCTLTKKLFLVPKSANSGHKFESAKYEDYFNGLLL